MPHDSTKATYEYFQCIINGLQGQVMVIDRDHRITDVNAAFLRQMGHSWEEVIG